MKKILINTVIALAIILLPSVVRADESIENKLTLMDWCYHASASAPLTSEDDELCVTTYHTLQKQFGTNEAYTAAMVAHQTMMSELLSVLPIDKFSTDTIIKIVFAKRRSL